MKSYGNKNLCILNGAWDEIYVRNWECDTEMSDASVRPVQNKVIKQYVDEKLEKIDTNLDSISKKLDEVVDVVKNMQEKPLEESKLIYF